jgi:hypothetical protein
MKIISNDGLIKRNRRIGQYSIFGSLAVLGIGMYISIAYPTQIMIAWGALILGFVISQVGMYYSNKFGRSPRPDEVLNQSLKGLDNRYSLFHFTTPASHLLLGPNGIWILLPFPQKGIISFQKGRYHHKGGNFMLKFFGGENLGRPELDAQAQVEDVHKFLVKQMPEEEIHPVTPLLVFTNDAADVQIDDNAPIPGVPIKKIKDGIRKKGKEAPLSVDQVKTLGKLFGDEED